MEIYHGEKMFEKTFIHPCVKLSLCQLKTSEAKSHGLKSSFGSHVLFPSGSV